MGREIKQLLSNNSKEIQEFVEMDLLPLLYDLVKELKEDERGDTSSKNENLDVENMYDFIVGQIFGLYQKGKEIKESADLREAIRLFGKMRYNQAIRDVRQVLISSSKDE